MALSSNSVESRVEGSPSHGLFSSVHFVRRLARISHNSIEKGYLFSVPGGVESSNPTRVVEGNIGGALAVGALADSAGGTFGGY